MGKLEVFGVSFDNEASVFYGGQVLSGAVVVQLNEPMNMRGNVNHSFFRRKVVGRMDYRD